ncbi:hypothetical protein [Guptibacillus algicola]|uniref:hypothetical protein n=1 Tax=Guptibacillus algicola TaxID=225844 RepID=UPI001CD640C0|nr:hypothetical protein [Alkalihalobacillus algicola]MCA0987877.1 hypothetical protein [Alkalihalobacillus algicola]
MVEVLLGLIAMFLGLGLFMVVIWRGIRVDSAKHDLEFLWENYTEVIEKEKAL